MIHRLCAGIVLLVAAWNVASWALSAESLNVLFIMTDQQRWDALGAAGNETIETPHLDQLAREGVYFENAYSACPVCVPDRTAILTGRSIYTILASSSQETRCARIAVSRSGSHSRIQGRLLCDDHSS